MIPLVSGKAYVYDYGRMYTFAHMCGNSLNTGDFYQGRIQPLAEGAVWKGGANIMQGRILLNFTDYISETNYSHCHSYIAIRFEILGTFLFLFSFRAVFT